MAVIQAGLYRLLVIISIIVVCEVFSNNSSQLQLIPEENAFSVVKFTDRSYPSEGNQPPRQELDGLLQPESDVVEQQVVVMDEKKEMEQPQMIVPEENIEEKEEEVKMEQQQPEVAKEEPTTVESQSEIGFSDMSDEDIRKEIPPNYIRPYNHPHIPWNISSTNIGPQYSKYALKSFGTLPINEYDYPDIVYPIPFNTLYNDHRTHYVNYSLPNPRFPSYIGLGDVSDDSFNQDNLVVVTGSSQNHLYANVNMMYSIIYTNCELPIVFVDYGLDEDGLDYLIRNMKIMHGIHLKLNSTAKLYYRKFDFSHFPAWVNISNPEIRGAYTWKVVSYFDVLNQTKRMIAWSDGGNMWTQSIVKDMIRTAAEGMFTPYSGDSLQRWVHGKSKQFLSSNKMVRKLFDGKGMCTGGYLLVNYYNENAMNNVIFPLLQCAYTRKCISPERTSRKNHRQDQAILSVLVHSASIRSSCGRYPTTVAFHRDCHEKNKCLNLRKRIISAIAHRYRIPLEREKQSF